MTRDQDMNDIKLFDLQDEIRLIGADVQEAIQSVLRSAWFIQGQRLAEFEKQFAEYLNTKPNPEGNPFVIGCASGTEAITLALRALGIGQGKCVITVPNTCTPTAAGIRQTGADLRFVDVSRDTLVMDPAKLDEALSSAKADAVVPVHLYGNVAPMRDLAEVCAKHGALLVEDCAQAHGASLDGVSAGLLGDAAAFSFYPSKNLGAYGDGGAVVTRSEETATRLKRLRNYGYDAAKRDWPEEEGLNSRLDEIQAAILLTKLKHLESWNQRRREIAAAYDDVVTKHANLREAKLVASCISSRHLYVVRTSERDSFRQHLSERRIQTGVHYPYPLHQTPAYKDISTTSQSFPVSEAAAKEVVSLPISPFLSDSDLKRVVTAIQEWNG